MRGVELIIIMFITCFGAIFLAGIFIYEDVQATKNLTDEQKCWHYYGDRRVKAIPASCAVIMFPS
jgi:hypothetical protein